MLSLERRQSWPWPNYCAREAEHLSWKSLACNSLSTWIQPVTSDINKWLFVNLKKKKDSIIILLKWISYWTKTLIDVTKVFYYIVGYKTLVLIFLVHAFSWLYSWNRNRWSYLTGWRIPEVWITWIKYCWYRVQCFYQSKPFIAFSILVILVFEMFDKYIWWISWFPVLSIYKFYPYLPKMFFSWERENGCFFFTYVVWTTIHHTTPKNHLMYIL